MARKRSNRKRVRASVSVNDDAERERSISSPVRKLPSELLFEVFVYCGSHGNMIKWTPSDSDIMKQPAWALSSTCWQWRRIALSCKPLWATICLDLHPTNRNTIPKITFESLKLLRATASWQQLSTCLRRSGEHPLTLEIRNCDMGSVRQLLLLRDPHHVMRLGGNTFIWSHPTVRISRYSPETAFLFCKQYKSVIR